MQFDRDHASPGSEQCGRHRACTRADVEDEVAGANARGVDEEVSPTGIELMPPPRARAGGHDGP